MKVLDKLWLDAGRFGIVKVQDDSGNIEFYCKAITHPTTEDNDVQLIVEWGYRLSPEMMKNFFRV
jgi:hypothetical protein